ncbi:unnamed protein product [Adineta ricciae]|uniref:F-box domain-containing protein n=1 Tax=Adineta ricciae TaxID=249248 RepID=A0A816G8E3_ADIRI|nr:unnamed protein product [Adineta ricciae]
MAEDYLSNLPVEILRHIFQYCDAITILHKIGSVCKRLRAVAYQYNEIKLEVTQTNYNALKTILHGIPSHAITSMEISYTIDNTEKAVIEYFTSQITRFTQMQYLLLRSVSNYYMKCFLQDLNGIQLISLTIDIRQVPNEFIYSIIPSVISKLNLQKFCCTSLNYKLKNISWPSDCKLTYLGMNSCLYSEYTNILQQLPYLKTLRLNEIIFDNEKMSDVSFTSRLTCLTLEDCSLSIEHLKLLVSKTPAIRNLTLAFHNKIFQSMADIYDWETFIRIQLNFLDKLEFFISYEYSFDHMINLELFVEPFKQSFWLNENHWNVGCEYIFEYKKKILLYTISSATRFRQYLFSTNGILLKQNNYYITKRENKQPIHIAPCHVKKNE